MEGLNRNDYCLAGLILFASLLFFLFLTSRMEQGARIEIMAGKEEYGIYSLLEEQEIVINQENKVIIKNGAARMIWASCPDQLCLHQKEISRSGETIVCLPNQIIITVLGGDKNALDGVAG